MRSDKIRFHHGIELDVTNLLGSPASGQQSELFTKAVDLLSSMRSLPSCNRLATSTLLDSCKSLDGPAGVRAQEDSKNLEATLDEVKSLYAARLAVCELVGAGAAVPAQCSSLMPSKKSKFKWNLITKRDRSDHEGDPTLVFEEVSAKQSSNCLKSLESRPQWWTSYSNGRQNAVVICHAVRSQIERHELLELHTAITSVNSDLHSSLFTSLENTKNELTKQKAFAETVEVFQTQLANDLKTTIAGARSYFDMIKQNLDSAFADVHRTILFTSKATKVEIDEMSQKIHSSNRNVTNLQKNIGSLWHEMVRGSAELAATQTRAWEASRVVMTDLQTSLENTRGQGIQDIELAFSTVQGQLKASSELVAIMQMKQTELDIRLASLDRAFESLERKAETFTTVQNQQADLQYQLGDSLKATINSAQLTIDQITASASVLHSTVNDATKKVNAIGWLGNLGNFFLSCAVLIGLLLFLYGISKISTVAAGWVAMILGVIMATIALNLTYHHHGLKYISQESYSLKTDSSSTVVYCGLVVALAVVSAAAIYLLQKITTNHSTKNDELIPHHMDMIRSSPYWSSAYPKKFLSGGYEIE
ncbi:MAG: hypothetical protein M1829_006054 [Trizodia sp. TS-e1964]|nr:MAG: hypothetical protein M1829_006054 [Trizodia sp. TS-e1964]